MCMGPIVYGGWWFIPMIFCGIMMIVWLFFFARGGVGRWRGHGFYCCCCDGSAYGQPPLDLRKARYARGRSTNTNSMIRVPAWLALGPEGH